MSDDLIKLDAPDGASGCSHDGVEYTVENGSVNVPAVAVNALLAHGFALPKPRKSKSELSA